VRRCDMREMGLQIRRLESGGDAPAYRAKCLPGSPKVRSGPPLRAARRAMPSLQGAGSQERICHGLLPMASGGRAEREAALVTA
jgi:hypothetical protein